MDKVYDQTKYEELIYSLWEKSGAFTPKIDKKKKPFTILLPLPNANDSMHMGHALFTVEDIMARYHRLLGEPTLWLPGGDHAGIETQFVFEKHLKAQGKSRFDYDRNTLFEMIKKYADENKDLNKNQMKRLGFSMDWTRYHYSLEPIIVEKILATFRKLHKDGLVYRGDRIVNYCTFCGTAYSELEVVYKEKDDFLYYLDYGIIEIATTRPETIFADVAVAVNPKDKRYLKFADKKATIPLINLNIPIITDPAIDTKFGTGALKVTPAHDPVDYEIGTKNNLEVISIIGTDGKLTKDSRVPTQVQGLYVNQARVKTLELLEQSGKLIKKEPIKHSVGTCYKCLHTIEPLLIPQWFVKTKPLAKPAIEAVKEGKTKIFPKKRFEKMYFDWMENIKDWNIGRQIVWGPRIPAWYCLNCNPEIRVNFITKDKKNISAPYSELAKKYSFDEIDKGLQSVSAPKNAKYQLTDGLCKTCKRSEVIQETDTFDTWFLSGQWPLTTLGFNPENPTDSSEDFKYFYPTSVMDTLWDILFFWVGRMMMFGLYLAKDVPFGVVHIHARVVDKMGRKMSKSKGNVINPIMMVDKYGADALRMALILGVAPASDIAISEEKIKGMRNFANKLWNISRFIKLKMEEKNVRNFSDLPNLRELPGGLKPDDKKIIKDLEKIIQSVTKKIESYKFGLASEQLYEFTWHEFADKYIEITKDRIVAGDIIPLVVLRHVLFKVLVLLHPFMPFVTEAIWQEMKDQRKFPDQMLITSSWPTTNS